MHEGSAALHIPRPAAGCPGVMLRRKRIGPRFAFLVQLLLAANCVLAAAPEAGECTRVSPAATAAGPQPASTDTSRPPMGPLTVSSLNLRYFADPAGHVVYLAGAHTWNDLIDMGVREPPRPFDFPAYLDFMRAHNLNLIRLWAWETTRPDDARDTPWRKIAAPQPWLRTGPGLDLTGQPKFDLTKLDPAYFHRLRQRVLAAKARGIYVSVMLFDGWSIQFSPGRNSHPFFGPNNVNGTDYLHDLRDIDTLRFPAITGYQRSYVAATLAAVADLDNVLIEIANEASPASTDWQRSMMEFVRCYEAQGGYRHPVGMSFQYPGGSNQTLFDSSADWISPGTGPGMYLHGPLESSGAKVVIADSDHLAGSSLDDPWWVYRGFFRGLNLLYMDRYVGPAALNPEQVTEAPAIRAALGEARLIAERLQIGKLTPEDGIASTGYALLGRQSLLVLAQEATAFEVNLSTLRGKLLAEWFDPAQARVETGPALEGGSIAQFRSPFPGGGILYLRTALSQQPSLTEIQPRARAIREASLTYAPLTIRWAAILRPAKERLLAGYRSLLLALTGGGILGALLGFCVGWRSRRRAS